MVISYRMKKERYRIDIEWLAVDTARCDGEIIEAQIDFMVIPMNVFFNDLSK